MSDSYDSLLLFGGTFDPIHNGHLIVARYVAEQLGASKTILIPAAQPPHKNPHELSGAKERLVMTCLAVENEPDFEVSDCEMNRSGPSYTLDTVRHFRTIHGEGTTLYWLIGADTIKDLPSWHKIDVLVDECTIVTAARPGYEQLDYAGLASVLTGEHIENIKRHTLETPLIDISATEIRRRVMMGQSIRTMTPAAVEQYIMAHRLYIQ